jgi:hypothetical protein
MHHPVIRPLHYGFSRIAQGSPRTYDVSVVLTPPGGQLEPHPLIVSPARVRAFLREIFPGAPGDPYLEARIALEEEHGPRDLTGDMFRDDIWASMGDLSLHLDPDGRIAFLARTIARPPSEDMPLFDIVDVVLPVYLAATAISSGAYDGLLNVRDRERRRFRWEVEVGERIAFPTPLAGPDPVGFPGRVPGAVPFGGLRPEPSDPRSWGRNLTRRNCRPQRLVESVLADLFAVWGYENDKAVVSEIMAVLGNMSTRPPSGYRKAA